MSTILLVEDDAWFAAQQQRILARAGYTVIHVPDAQAAIDQTEETDIQAIVLDVLLAYNTAFTLLHELQSYEETSKLPVVLYTTQAESLDAAALKSYGVRVVLDKTTMRPDDTARALAKVGV